MKKLEKKEITCQLCGNTFNEANMRERTTDIFLGINWGVPSWEVVRCCPFCGYSCFTNPIKDKKAMSVLREQWQFINGIKPNQTKKEVN